MFVLVDGDSSAVKAKKLDPPSQFFWTPDAFAIAKPSGLRNIQLRLATYLLVMNHLIQSKCQNLNISNIWDLADPNEKKLKNLKVLNVLRYW